MLDLIKIGSFISNVRKEQGLTQKQLAERVGVSDKAVSRWETGKGLPDTSIMSDLCEVLGININELLSGERLDADTYSGKAEKIMVDLVRDAQKSRNERKSVIIGLLLGVLFLIVGMLFIAFVSGSSLVYYLDTPSFIIVIAFQFILLGAGGQMHNFISAFKLIFSKHKEDLLSEVEHCEYAIKYARMAAILGGILSSIMGFVTVFAIVFREAYDVLGPNLAVAVLSLFYGILISIILMPIQGRLHKMY
ncbi:helix-turn-helix domain-containing protein [Pseudobutyrivibrio sp.]